MSPPPRPSRALAALSALLLVTGLALLGTAAARLAAVLAPWRDTDVAGEVAPFAARGWSELGAIEPAAGPAGDGPAAAQAAPLPQAAKPGDDDPATVAALESMAAELGRYQAALAERERRLVLREAVTASLEGRIDEQLGRLEALKGELERLNGQLAAEDKAKIAQLVKVYEAMKAKNAAAIFDPMALDLLLPIVRGMRETKVAAIVAEMDPAKARALTAELARGRDRPAGP